MSDGGIVATNGATFRISSISIEVNKETGEVKIDGGKPSIHYDVCPVWLDIAIDHLTRAKAARDELIEKQDDANQELKFQALEKEFRASMQAMTSATIAIDALYAVIRRNLPSAIPAYEPGKRRPARHAQVSEAIKQSFCLKENDFQTVRDAIKQMYGFRDQSVHPTGDFNAPVLHPVLKVGLEKRQVVFRYENAFKIVQFAVALISELAIKAKPSDKSIAKYADGLAKRIIPIRSQSILELPPL